jgi:glycine/D-amino acid oxidase-like deaminating enzyme
MQLSYWELKNWFSNVDYTIVGSGIVGLHCALALREKFPTAKILVLEKGILPQGASTKKCWFCLLWQYFRNYFRFKNAYRRRSNSTGRKTRQRLAIATKKLR